MSKKIAPYTGEFCELPLQLNAEDIAAVMHCSRASAYEIMHDRTLPVVAVGKRRLVKRDTFQKWLDAHEKLEG